MKLIKPSYEIMTTINGEGILAAIEHAARTCYKSESKVEFDDEGKAISARPLIQKLVNLGHDAMLEFGGMITVKFICDRGVSHELVRHRLCSFAQESTRYCNYGKQEHVQFIIPCWSTLSGGFYDDLQTAETYSEVIWMECMLHAEKSYLTLIQNGWALQQARSVLPNSLKTEINMSANTREWRHIFRQRVSKAAHPQMRELMIPLLEEFKKRIPLLYDDITY